ncbi:MAG: hypothetical protein KGH59_03355 [Candidatus Micrarchaeota archaeon]|nr:hypothetical protein [Candidatus Micrarchaeota archaeon]MDE1847188.1 hypothetical protein [Candidatus Micrarchaeota archaeon]
MDRDSKSNAILIATSATVETVTKLTATLLETELRKLLADPNITVNIAEITPYLYVAGFLSLSGREITKENVTELLGVVGVKPREELIAALMVAGVKSHLVYVYAYYFLLTMGKEAGTTELLEVLKAIGISGDEDRAQEAITFIRRQLGMMG